MHLRPLSKNDVVNTGLFKSISKEMIEIQHCRLEYTPSSENLPHTAYKMTKDFIEDGYGDDDCDRIVYALKKAAKEFPRFPTYYHVKQFLLPRKEFDRRILRTDQKQLANNKPELPEEKRKDNTKRIKELISTLSAPKKEEEKKGEEYKPITPDPERRARIERELRAARESVDRTKIKTPQQIEDEDNG